MKVDTELMHVCGYVDGVAGDSLLPVSVDCLNCQHWGPEFGQCAAFPAGIPEKILNGRTDHRSPEDGDGGKQFLPI